MHRDVSRHCVMRALSSLTCSNCAISTHSGQGAKRIGQGKSQHGVVYTGNAPPPISSNEIGMQPIPVRINTDEKNDALDATSRLHYGKLYTTEYKLRVKAYGMVHDSSLAPLTSQFREVNVGRLGFLDSPLQTHEEEPTPAVINDARSKGPRPSSNAVDKSRFISPKCRQAMARHPTGSSSGAAASSSRRNVTNVTTRGGKAAVPALERSVRAPSRQVPNPPRAVLVGMGFNEPQIRLVYDLVAANASPAYAIARVRAIREGYAESHANLVALKVEAGANYTVAI